MIYLINLELVEIESFYRDILPILSKIFNREVIWKIPSKLTPSFSC